ncbi:MAG: NADH-quinone oxidoreductase subunit N [Verrucomicrobiae bacterium]|nr:NADH-quinone oxidoreductase subunit N [Verrucomicrobiae bacterium]
MIHPSVLRLELAVVGLMLAVLLGDAFARKASRRYWGAAVAAALLALAGYAAAGAGILPNASARVFTAEGGFLVDAFALWVKVFALVATAVCVLLTSRTPGEDAPGFAEQVVLQLGVGLGMMVLGSARDLISFYVSLELMAIGLYLLVAWRKEDPLSLEAGVKYLVYGAMASAILLYGMALVYGAAGSLEFGIIRQAAATRSDSIVLLAGFALLLAGLGFKVSAVPFHWWTPDAYEGAPVPSMAALSLLSKPAGFIILARLLFDVFWPLHAMWQGPVAWAGAATLLWGGLGGLSQTNLKRLLAYSGISHSGFMLLALASPTRSGVAAMLYYLLAYLLSAGLVFTAMCGAAGPGARYDLRDLSGLGRKSPWLAGALLLGLFGLGGIPPLAGFFGKLLVIRCVVSESGWGFAAAAVGGAVGSLYYYLVVVKAALSPEENGAPPIAPVGRSLRALTAALAFGLLLVGAWPASVWGALRNAAEALCQ